MYTFYFPFSLETSSDSLVLGSVATRNTHSYTPPVSRRVSKANEKNKKKKERNTKERKNKKKKESDKMRLAAAECRYHLLVDWTVAPAKSESRGRKSHGWCLARPYCFFSFLLSFRRNGDDLESAERDLMLRFQFPLLRWSEVVIDW